MNQSNFQILLTKQKLNNIEKSAITYWNKLKIIKTDIDKIDFFNKNPEVFEINDGSDLEIKHRELEFTTYQFENLDSLEFFGNSINRHIREYIYFKSDQGECWSLFKEKMNENDIKDFYENTKSSIFTDEFKIFAINNTICYLKNKVIKNINEIEFRLEKAIRESIKSFDEDEIYDLIEEKAKLWKINFEEMQIEIVANKLFKKIYGDQNHESDYQIKKLVPSYFELGRIKFKSKDYSGAINDFNKEIEIHPNNADAFWKRGVAKTFSGDQDGANDDFMHSLELKKNY